MTGFDIVGRVVAQYQHLIDEIHAQQDSKSGRRLMDLLKNVLEEQIVFHNWIGYLLMRSVPVAELRSLLDPQSPSFTTRWNDQRLDQAIQQSCRTSQVAFLLETLRDIYKELQGIQADVSTVRPSVGKITAPVKGVQGARGGSGMREHLLQLQKLNQRLEHVRATSRVRKAPSTLFHQVTTVKVDLSLSQHATNIHQAIQKGYQCPCTQPHLTKLCLPTTLKNNNILPQPGAKPCFELLFSVEEDDDQHEPDDAAEPPGDMNLSMTMSNVSINASRTGTETPTYSPSTSTTALTRRDSIFSKINSNLSTNSSIHNLPGSRSCSFVVTESSSGKEKEIEDICPIIRRGSVQELGQAGSSTIGALPATGHIRYELEVPTNSPILTGSMTSLEDIVGSEWSSTRQNRSALALRLSIAIVQFCSTPWIENQWTWGNFSILDMQKREWNAGRLYVAHKFYSCRCDQKQPVKWPTNMLGIISKEQALIRLGCALVELAFGERFANMNWPSLAAVDSGERDLIIAHQIFESGRLFEEGEAYHNVVEMCFNQAVPQAGGPKSMNRNDPSFRDDAMRAIVEPLHQIWRDEWGIFEVQTVH